ncbi:caspase-8 [Lampris incognitus]|uniref:caspase-8 n=1 Tax=Lampris incognitus TaxID=2546036 RepID=UPI0024B547DB|nr:caspase-8 [Lampris incognitus]XP_056145230.1 caspase-8 [Lampris incognitus]
MDFQKLLLQVDQALDKDGVKALVFLCSDLLPRDLSSIHSSRDLFSILTDRNIISAQQPHLLRELLYTIKRLKLVRKLGLTDSISTTGSLVSPYRKLLYDLSEDITEDNLSQIKFLLRARLPRKKLEDDVTTLELFLEMEHQDLLSETDLNLLVDIFKNVCPALARKISQFEAENVSCSGPVAQETEVGYWQPKAACGVPEPHQASSMTLARSSSCGSEGFYRSSSFESPLPSLPTSLQSWPQPQQPSMSLCNTSKVSPTTSISEDEALSSRLSHLSTETSLSTTSGDNSNEIDAEGFSENQSSTENKNFGSEHVQPGHAAEEDVQIYPMTGTQRGVCLIVNNYDFKQSKMSLKNRGGTHIDKESLESVFNWLGFEMQIENDCTKAKMLSVVQTLAERDHSQMACLACCILSHGKEGRVYGVDGLDVCLRELTQPFRGSRCSSLREKPKLFFVQACQGTREQEAVQIQPDGPTPGAVDSDAFVPRCTIPGDADFLMAMATVPQFVSFRDKNLGTWFIQSLCQNLVSMVPRGVDLVSILTKVNDDVSRKTDRYGEKKQMPQPAFSLRKKVVFPIPEHPPPSLPVNQSNQ